MSIKTDSPYLLANRRGEEKSAIFVGEADLIIAPGRRFPGAGREMRGESREWSESVGLGGFRARDISLWAPNRVAAPRESLSAAGLSSSRRHAKLGATGIAGVSARFSPMRERRNCSLRANLP